jgi:glycosyltransferase involved in cell wall biosynthesis
MRRADLVVTVSEPLADLFRTKTTAPVAVVTNGFEPLPEDSWPEPNARATSGESSMSLALTGAYNASIYDLNPLFVALAQIKEGGERVRLVLAGPGTDQLVPMAAKYGVEEWIDYRGTIDHERALQIQAAATLLVLPGWIRQGGEGVLTGKVFEYLGARRPILVVGGPESGSARLVRQLGAGFISDEPTAIAAWLHQCLVKWHNGGVLAPLNMDQLAPFTRESQVKRLEDLLRELVATDADDHADRVRAMSASSRIS